MLLHNVLLGAAHCLSLPNFKWVQSAAVTCFGLVSHPGKLQNTSQKVDTSSRPSRISAPRKDKATPHISNNRLLHKTQLLQYITWCPLSQFFRLEVRRSSRSWCYITAYANKWWFHFVLKWWLATGHSRRTWSLHLERMIHMHRASAPCCLMIFKFADLWERAENSDKEAWCVSDGEEEKNYICVVKSVKVILHWKFVICPEDI